MSCSIVHHPHPDTAGQHRRTIKSIPCRRFTVSGPTGGEWTAGASNTGVALPKLDLFHQQNDIGRCMQYQASKFNTYETLVILFFLLCSHEGRMMPDILSDMLSRTQTVPIQLSASRCLTYLHRSGSLASTDHRIVYKVMPCLARLCTAEFDDTTRASAAETLAYLTEIDIDLQRLASISNHLIESLVTLLKLQTAEAKQVTNPSCLCPI